MEEKALVEKVLEAEQDGKRLPIEWSHSQEGLTHYFTVKDVVRREEASAVNLSWDGAPIRIDNRGRRDVEVPALGAFEVVSVEPVLGETRHVLVRFSDSLARDQNLQGLIRIEKPSADLRDRGQCRPGLFDAGVPRQRAPSMSCRASAIT